MIVRLTPKYKFVCDRCGKEEYTESDEPKFEVAFIDVQGLFKTPTRVRGQVCYRCYKDFYEIAGNFFDKVNKRREGEV